jgi:hypothetical protein
VQVPAVPVVIGELEKLELPDLEEVRGLDDLRPLAQLRAVG